MIRRTCSNQAVGLVIWPVKIVPKMTYYVSSGTLNPTHSLTHILIARASTLTVTITCYVNCFTFYCIFLFVCLLVVM